LGRRRIERRVVTTQMMGLALTHELPVPSPIQPRG
jgi:hypothetical protein